MTLFQMIPRSMLASRQIAGNRRTSGPLLELHTICQLNIKIDMVGAQYKARLFEVES